MSDKNSVVWAKLKFCPFWPARLVEPPEEIVKRPPRKLCVLFFGTNNYGFVDPENVKNYFENESKYTNKGRGKTFQDAIVKCKEFMQDPNNFCSIVPPAVVVKEEYDFVVKNEPNTQYLYKRQVLCPPASHACVMCREKDIEIGQIKSENIKLHSDLMSAKEKIHHLTIGVEQNDISHQNQNDQRKNENECLQTKLLVETKPSSDDVFEVEKILKHKQYRKKRTFLVRWADYDSSHDSWVKEENICDEAIKDYFKSLETK